MHVASQTRQHDPITLGHSMKTIVIILRWALAVGLSLVGLLATAWGIFCLFGGPDPGAGSERDGLKWGIGFIAAALVMFLAARFVWKILR